MRWIDGLLRSVAVGVVLGAACVGCDVRTASDLDGGSRSDGGAPAIDGDVRSDDASARRDAGPAADAGPETPACVPSSGSRSAGAYCDLFHLALVDDGAGAVEARLFGRLGPDGLADDGCATVDEVEVQEGGTTIGTLPGVGAYAHGDPRALLARAPALEAMRARCGGDADRFGGFGFLVRGRMDGGRFEARCADAEGGGRWPPALVVSCHENVDAHPFGAYASVDTFDAFTFTTIDVTVPHDPGGALLTVDPTVHVIPHAYAFGGGVAPDPFDLVGLEGSVSEGSAPLPGPYSSLYLSTMGDPLGVELCPFGSTGTGPEPEPPPVMLMRLTGTSERGAYSTEVYVDMCTRVPPAP